MIEMIQVVGGIGSDGWGEWEAAQSSRSPARTNLSSSDTGTAL